MKNAHLYEAIKEYCKVAIALLDEIPKEDLPIFTKEKSSIIVGPPARPVFMARQPVTEIDWFRFVRTNERSLQRTEAHKAAIQAMEEDEKVARHLNIPAGKVAEPIVDGDWCLLSLLVQLLQKQQDMNFQEAVFDKIYGEFEDYFYPDVLEHRYLCPLTEFHMEAERIELGPKFSIITVPEEEKDGMLTRLSLGSLPYLSRHTIDSMAYAFEFYIEVPKVIGETPAIPQEDSSDQVAIERFDEARSALRLFKNGAVDYHFIQKTTCGDPFRFIETHGSSRPKPRLGLYVLLNSEISAFLEFWQFYQKVRRSKQNRIELALRRFNYGYERKRPEDRLIDYMIGFEALLLGEEQELRYKLALRGSALLGRNSDERERTFNELHEAYKQRNKIVHGSTPKGPITIGSETVQFKELVNKVEEHLRSVIKEFLVRCERQSASKVMKALDEMIVSGFQSKESIRDL